MIVKNFRYFFISIILASCDSVPNNYFKRPEISPIISNGDGTGFRNGELVPDLTNNLCITPKEYNELYEFYDDIELRLYICLKYNRRCR